MTEKEPHIYGTVKVGDRGQVVIPADARKDLNLKPGDLCSSCQAKTDEASPWSKQTP